MPDATVPNPVPQALRDCLTIRAGASARQRLLQGALKPSEIGCVPAAAGGPKGLILNQLDRWLQGSWLAQAPRQRIMIGASIGAWRAAAACMDKPADAFARLAEFYCDQHYSAKPGPDEVAQVCQRIIDRMLADGHGDEILQHPQHRLQVLVNRGTGRLGQVAGQRGEKPAFAVAALANLRHRNRLAAHVERWVFSAHLRSQRAADTATAQKSAPQSTPTDITGWLHTGFDAFATRHAALTNSNLADALLASGTIPLLIAPVRNIAGAAPGAYWDGGIIDYHLHLPYDRLPNAADDLVLYPHFISDIIPGWLDKSLPWRRASGPWLDRTILVAPSDSFVRQLPRGKLPDRKDFPKFGTDHQARIRAWHRDIAEAERLAEAMAAFVEHPQAFTIRPL